MGIATFPAPAGGGIKSVQRGSAGASGNVTITSVDIAKSFVTVFGSASSGTVSASFGMSQAAGNPVMQGATVQVAGGNLFMPPSATAATATDTGVTTAAGRSWTKTEAVNNGAITVNAGSNNLVSAVVTGFLAGATTLTVSGACRYEVVEFA
jgi:hypothetical protein